MKSLHRGALLARLFFSVLCFSSLSGCVTAYVDATVKQVASDAFVAKEPKHPAQVIFAFQTKGVDNVRATTAGLDIVIDEIRSTRLFSEVSTEPVAGGALLAITINDVSLIDGAAAKAFFTGMTFGLVGTTAGDGYICQLDYTPGPGQKTISAEARHALYGTIGVTPGPNSAIQMPSIKDAVTNILHTIVSIALFKVSSDPTFH